MLDALPHEPLERDRKQFKSLYIISIVVYKEKKKLKEHYTPFPRENVFWFLINHLLKKKNIILKKYCLLVSTKLLPFIFRLLLLLILLTTIITIHTYMHTLQL